MTSPRFIIVVREKDFKPFEKRPGRDAWGWEPADGVVIDSYTEASRMLKEYQAAMPSHTVRLRVLPEENL